MRLLYFHSLLRRSPDLSPKVSLSSAGDDNESWCQDAATLHAVVSTLGRDAKIDWKALSQRIGNADVAFTMKQYVQTDLEAGRQHTRGANHRRVADFVRDHWDGSRGGVSEHEVYKSVYKPHTEGPFSVRERASGLGSGGRI